METNDKDSITIPGEFVMSADPSPFPKGWKALYFSLPQRPKGTRQWVNFLWGWDIFYGRFPLIKSLLAANILVWVVLVVTLFIK